MTNKVARLQERVGSACTQVILASACSKNLKPAVERKAWTLVEYTFSISQRTRYNFDISIMRVPRRLRGKKIKIKPYSKRKFELKDLESLVRECFFSGCNISFQVRPMSTKA